ncbi:hypothetical protein K2Q00_03340 [Patescibacteria group bacterium]|nr:hypothetical protein [Patescibacteria group bacterium]
MLSIEERFVGAYMYALSEALMQTRVKAVVDTEASALFTLVKSITNGGLTSKKKPHSLIELPIIFALRFQRDPTMRTQFVKHQFLECSRQEKRNAHDRAILRSAYLAELLEGRGSKGVQDFVLRSYSTGVLFTTDVGGLAKDGFFFPLPGGEKSIFPFVPGDARMFTAACFGALYGPKKLTFADWQEKLIENHSGIKDLGRMLFRAAYGYEV